MITLHLSIRKKKIILQSFRIFIPFFFSLFLHFWAYECVKSSGFSILDQGPRLSKGGERERERNEIKDAEGKSNISMGNLQWNEKAFFVCACSMFASSVRARTQGSMHCRALFLQSRYIHRCHITTYFQGKKKKKQSSRNYLKTSIQLTFLWLTSQRIFYMYYNTTASFMCIWCRLNHAMINNNNKKCLQKEVIYQTQVCSCFFFTPPSSSLYLTLVGTIFRIHSHTRALITGKIKRNLGKSTVISH